MAKKKTASPLSSVVEQPPRKGKVGSSILSGGSKKKRRSSYKTSLLEAKSDLTKAYKDLAKAAGVVAQLTTKIPQLREAVIKLGTLCGEDVSDMLSGFPGPKETPRPAMALAPPVPGAQEEVDNRPLTEEDLPKCQREGCTLPYAHTHESPTMVRRINLPKQPPAESVRMEGDKMKAVVDSKEGWG